MARDVQVVVKSFEGEDEYPWHVTYSADGNNGLSDSRDNRLESMSVDDHGVRLSIRGSNPDDLLVRTKALLSKAGIEYVEDQRYSSLVALNVKTKDPEAMVKVASALSDKVNLGSGAYHYSVIGQETAGTIILNETQRLGLGLNWNPVTPQASAAERKMVEIAFDKSLKTYELYQEQPGGPVRLAFRPFHGDKYFFFDFENRAAAKMFGERVNGIARDLDALMVGQTPSDDSRGSPAFREEFERQLQTLARRTDTKVMSLVGYGFPGFTLPARETPTYPRDLSPNSPWPEARA